MATLVTRDRVDNGGSGVLTTRPGHVEVARFPTFKRWATGTPGQFRVAGSLAQIHYPAAGPWEPWDAANLDACPEVDLRATLSSRAGVALSMAACAFTVDFGDDYSLTVARGGASVTFRPLGLAWVNTASQRQVIARPTLGLTPVIDEDGWWVRDAFGPGLDWGVRLWSHQLCPVVRIANAAALLGPATRPTIALAGLRLAKILSVGWSGGVPGLFTGTVLDADANLAIPGGEADEKSVDPAPFALEHPRGPALWALDAEAWEESGERRWGLERRWLRYAGRTILVVGMKASDLQEAAGPIVFDTTMATQTDTVDALRQYGATDNFVQTLLQVGCVIPPGSGSTYRDSSGMKFTPPLDQGVTINTASITVTDYGAQSNNTVNSKLRCEATDNAADFSTKANWDARFPSGVAAHTVNWDGIGAFSTGNTHQTPDIASCLQDVVSRSGWVSGNGMVIFWDDYDGRSTASSYVYRMARGIVDGSSTAPKLDATYTGPPTFVQQVILL